LAKIFFFGKKKFAKKKSFFDLLTMASKCVLYHLGENGSSFYPSRPDCQDDPLTEDSVVGDDAFLICWSDDHKYVAVVWFSHEYSLWSRGHAKEACLKRLQRSGYLCDTMIEDLDYQSFKKWFKVYQKRKPVKNPLNVTNPDEVSFGVKHEQQKEVLLERQVLYSVRMFPGHSGHGAITSRGAEKMMAIVYTKQDTELRYGASIWRFCDIPLMEHGFEVEQKKLKAQAEVRFNLFPMVIDYKYPCECDSCFEKFLVKCVEKFGVRSESSKWTMIHELQRNEEICALNAVRLAFKE
jgi:hypothetical protein